ncbi:hypothetical protein ES703_86823 [subsurface metagenome]
MKHELWYSVVVRDRQGKVVSRERRKSKSFLKQWNQLVYVGMAGTTLNITDTGGTPRAVFQRVQAFAMNAPATNTNYGIRVGTGNTPVDISDFQLETPIDEGVGGGQMEHLVCTVDLAVVAAPSCSFGVHRTIANNSGVVITVREAVIYMKLNDTPYYGCGVRDVLDTPQAVPNGGAITIDWTIQVTV